MAERLAVPMKPGNSGGGKKPQLKGNARSQAGRQAEADEQFPVGDLVKLSPRAGCLKQARPVVRPGNAGVYSGRQTHRGKSQKPRSLDSGEEGNRISEAYRQSHLQGGEQVIGP
jgi:hypothetical protein